nr:YwgA family protein [Geomicrobium halophilum]
MSLLKSVGEITGRKKFQKIIYISKKMGMPFQEKYDFHIYGPYSEELSMRIEELQQFGFVSEVREEKAGYHQYRYQLAMAGEQFLETNTQRQSFEQEKTVIDEMNACTSKFLELVSTVLYLEPAPKEEVVEKVHTLKKTQNYSRDDIEEAFAYIRQWRHKANSET